LKNWKETLKCVTFIKTFSEHNFTLKLLKKQTIQKLQTRTPWELCCKRRKNDNLFY